MAKFGRILAGVAVAVLTAAAGLAQDRIREERVAFAPGAASATVTGRIKGDGIVDYKLAGAAGRTMAVSMRSGNRSAYFNVMEPGSRDVAVFVGSTSGDRFAGALAATGDYTFRVHLMRNAARRNETANYTITVALADGQAGAAPAGDARVAGTPYHATGKVPCSIGAAPARSSQCGFGVVRGARGNADVHLTSPGGDATARGDVRWILRFAGDAVTVADPAVRVTATRTGDEWSIRIGDSERFVVPEAVIFGG